MTTLEEILQEIDSAKDEYGMVGYIDDKPVIAKEQAKEIVKKHLSSNDEWTAVEDGLPEANEKVDITFREWMEHSKKYRYGTCNAVYIPKNSVKTEDMWSDYENDVYVDYDEEFDAGYVPEGWYETVEHSEECSYCYINCEVVAWRPLPAPYRPEKGE